MPTAEHKEWDDLKKDTVDMAKARKLERDMDEEQDPEEKVSKRRKLEEFEADYKERIYRTLRNIHKVVPPTPAKGLGKGKEKGERGDLYEPYDATGKGTGKGASEDEEIEKMRIEQQGLEEAATALREGGAGAGGVPALASSP